MSIPQKRKMFAISSAEKSSPPASAIVANTSRGYHILKIDGYSLTKGTPTAEALDSCPFTMCGYRWRIRYYHQEMPAPKFVSVPPSDLNQHLGDLLATGEGADVVFEVAGETFAAHRWLLASRSSVFRAGLFGSMKEGGTEDVIRIHDMEAQVLRALLHFAYTDSLPETTEEETTDAMCQHLLVAADRYGFERLKLVCEEKLCKYIDVCTAGTILALAEQHRCDGLKKACFHFLSSLTNLTAAAATDGFQHLSRSCPSVMTELIAMSSRVHLA